MFFNLLLPALFGAVWMSIFGGTAIELELYESAELVGVLNEKGPEGVMYALMTHFPGCNILVPVFLFVTFISLVTAADSTTSAMSSLSSKDITLENPEPSKFVKIAWGVMMGLVAWIMMVLGVACFSMVKEPRDLNVRRSGGLGRYVAELSWIVKRNKNYRRFLLTRILRGSEHLALPFYIVFARERLGLPDKAAASFFIVTVLATIPASLAWGRLSDRLGNRLVIIFTTLTSLGAPLFALGLVVAARFGAFEAGEISLAGTSIKTSTMIMWVIAPVFVLIKAAGVGGFIGFSNYVMDIAPDRRRPLYLGLQTSLQGVLIMIVPTLGGAIIDLTRVVLGREAYWVVFAMTAVALTASLMSARRLEEPRVHHARDILRPMPRQA